MCVYAHEPTHTFVYCSSDSTGSPLPASLVCISHVISTKFIQYLLHARHYSLSALHG